MKNRFTKIFSSILIFTAASILISSTLVSCRIRHRTKYGGPTADYKKNLSNNNKLFTINTETNSSSL
ncbi:MAG: hypothetical protein JXR58_03245 [Bacteroidales bacterium]|nr:hypothetical protein [Bacteroidales bacterium]